MNLCSETLYMDVKRTYGGKGRIIISTNTAKVANVEETENILSDGDPISSETNNGRMPRSSRESVTTNPTVSQVPLKRKRGRPRKETSTSQQTTSIDIPAQTSRTSLLSYDSTEDPGEGELDTEKSKRKRRSKILDDFVADFNTSDEEDDAFFSSLKFPSRGRGRGRGRKVEVSDPFDDDLFSSYVLGKKFSIDDFPSDGFLGDMNESDEDIFTPSELDTNNRKSDLKINSVASDGLEGVIGPNGNAKVQIINTGQTEMVDNEEYMVYHVITSAASTKTITPLRIPKSDAKTEAHLHSQPSSSRQTENKQKRGSSNAQMSSQKKRQSQSVSQQVASLRQKYYQALQELRKRPQMYTLADLVYGASNFLTEDQLIFFTLQLKSRCDNIQGIRFSVREKMLALGFYLQSPGLYKWLRSVFHLPSKLILDRWLEGLAKTDPDAAKRLVYQVYTRYVFKS